MKFGFRGARGYGVPLISRYPLRSTVSMEGRVPDLFDAIDVISISFLLDNKCFQPCDLLFDGGSVTPVRSII